MNFYSFYSRLGFTFFISMALTLSAAGAPVHATIESGTGPRLNGEYDAASTGDIAYVAASSSFSGKDTLMLYNPLNPEQPDGRELYTSSGSLLDPAFSADGTKLAFIETWGQAGFLRLTSMDDDDNTVSAIKVLDLQTGNLSNMIKVEHAISEIEFAPDGKSVFFLQAETAKSVLFNQTISKTTFDVYQIQINASAPVRHTQLKSSEIESLKIAPDGQSFYLAFPSGSLSNNQYKQQIREFPLGSGNNTGSAISHSSNERLSEFSWNKDQTLLYYHSEARSDQDGSYKDKLFVYNPVTKTDKQLTTPDGYVHRPVAVGDRLYFMTGLTRFGYGQSVLYAMPAAGGEPVPVELPAPPDKSLIIPL
ncbi:hypothetical protein ACE3NQ_08050 [Paenibacillus terreus]|uniref:WD40-like Beta Propeller Repeat n=1 Tax=Paenibacillus terreus TaxID=1387834 RepID=A0ABV5B590_9BACL